MVRCRRDELSWAGNDGATRRPAAVPAITLVASRRVMLLLTLPNTLTSLMIIYSVTIVLQAGIESDWVEWMTKVHVPDVLKTGCFLECRFHKVVGSADEELSYVLQYRCRSLAEYHRYRDNFAPALQKEHSNRFAGKFRGSRGLFEEVARFAPTQGL